MPIWSKWSSQTKSVLGEGSSSPSSQVGGDHSDWYGNFDVNSRRGQNDFNGWNTAVWKATGNYHTISLVCRK